MSESKSDTTELVRKKLNDKQLQVVSYIEQKFWETGHLPTNEKVASELAHYNIDANFVKRCWNDDSVRLALTARGIDFEPETSSEILTPIQVVVVNMLLNTADKRSTREKLKDVNVSPQQFAAWQRQPAFSSYLRKRAEQLFADSSHLFYKNVIDNMDGGDLQAAKFYAEVTGIYNPKLEVNVNIQTVVLQLIEVVAKHVKDPVVLQAIASDVEALNSGS